MFLIRLLCQNQWILWWNIHRLLACFMQNNIKEITVIGNACVRSKERIWFQNWYLRFIIWRGWLLPSGVECLACHMSWASNRSRLSIKISPATPEAHEVYIEYVSLLPAQSTRVSVEANTNENSDQCGVLSLMTALLRFLPVVRMIQKSCRDGRLHTNYPRAQSHDVLPDKDVGIHRPAHIDDRADTCCLLQLGSNICSNAS